MELRIGSCAEWVQLPGSVTSAESFCVLRVHVPFRKYRSNSWLVWRGFYSPHVKHRKRGLQHGAALLPCLNKSFSSSFSSPAADIFAPISVFQPSHLFWGQREWNVILKEKQISFGFKDI